MKKVLFVFLFLFILVKPAAAAENWTTTDTKYQAVYTAFLVADWLQTRYIATHSNHLYERNPVLGKHPSLKKVNVYFFVAGFLGDLLIARLLPHPHRRRLWQVLSAALESFCVYSNTKNKVGFNIHFRF